MIIHEIYNLYPCVSWMVQILGKIGTYLLTRGNQDSCLGWGGRRPWKGSWRMRAHHTRRCSLAGGCPRITNRHTFPISYSFCPFLLCSLWFFFAGHHLNDCNYPKFLTFNRLTSGLLPSLFLPCTPGIGVSGGCLSCLLRDLLHCLFWTRAISGPWRSDSTFTGKGWVLGLRTTASC